MEPVLSPRSDSIAMVLPVSNLGSVARLFEQLLGIAPTFVDGEKWAQFDPPGGRLCLAGTDRTFVSAGLMIKVTDLTAARQQAERLGLTTGPIENGVHESRFVANGPDAWPLIFYAKVKGNPDGC